MLLPIVSTVTTLLHISLDGLGQVEVDHSIEAFTVRLHTICSGCYQESETLGLVCRVMKDITLHS